MLVTGPSGAGETTVSQGRQRPDPARVQGLFRGQRHCRREVRHPQPRGQLALQDRRGLGTGPRDPALQPHGGGRDRLRRLQLRAAAGRHPGEGRAPPGPDAPEEAQAQEPAQTVRGSAAGLRPGRDTLIRAPRSRPGRADLEHRPARQPAGAWAGGPASSRGEPDHAARGAQDRGALRPRGRDDRDERGRDPAPRTPSGGARARRVHRLGRPERAPDHAALRQAWMGRMADRRAAHRRRGRRRGAISPSGPRGASQRSPPASPPRAAQRARRRS